MIEVALLAALLFTPRMADDTFDVQAELQGLYDEISQATMQFADASDVDAFHDVLYTPDWSYTDSSGHTQTWQERRQEAVAALSTPRPDAITQPIKTVSMDGAGATVVVNLVTVRTVVDHEARYGRPDASHTVTETTPYRDRWVKVSDEWKLKSRQQIGRSTESVDKPE